MQGCVHGWWVMLFGSEAPSSCCALQSIVTMLHVHEQSCIRVTWSFIAFLTARHSFAVHSLRFTQRAAPRRSALR